MNLSEKVKAEITAIQIYDESFFDELLKFTLTELNKKFDPYIKRI